MVQIEVDGFNADTGIGFIYRKDTIALLIESNPFLEASFNEEISGEKMNEAVGFIGQFIFLKMSITDSDDICLWLFDPYYVWDERRMKRDFGASFEILKARKYQVVSGSYDPPQYSIHVRF